MTAGCMPNSFSAHIHYDHLSVANRKRARLRGLHKGVQSGSTYEEDMCDSHARLYHHCDSNNLTVKPRAQKKNSFLVTWERSVKKLQLMAEKFRVETFRGCSSSASAESQEGLTITRKPHGGKWVVEYREHCHLYSGLWKTRKKFHYHPTISSENEQAQFSEQISILVFFFSSLFCSIICITSMYMQLFQSVDLTRIILLARKQMCLC